MSGFGDRLREERDRLDLSQSAFAAVAGVQRVAQGHYESGKRSPDGDYLTAVAAAGVDVRYVITGMRDNTTASSLRPDEQRLLALYRLAEPAVRKAVVGALATDPDLILKSDAKTFFVELKAAKESVLPSARSTEKALSADAPEVLRYGDRSVTVGGKVNQRIEGPMVVHGSQTFHMGGSAAELPRRGRKPKG